MRTTIRISIEDTSQIAECRRVAREQARELGFAETRTEEVAIVVTEAATNILKHAGSGEVLINSFPVENGQAAPWMEILALDRGAGFDNLEKCLQDGYSTGSSPGHGFRGHFSLIFVRRRLFAIRQGYGHDRALESAADRSSERSDARHRGRECLQKG